MPASRVHFPAAYGGINVLSGIGNTKPPDATYISNWIPRSGYLTPRKGFAFRYNAPLGGGSIQSMMPHSGGSLVIGGNGQLNAVNATTWVSIATSAGPYASNQWQYTQFQDRLILCNGSNTPVSWNGTAFANLVITGVTASTLIGCQTYKGRVYYWQANARSFWYPIAGAFQGALTQFDLGTFVDGAGTLLCLVPVTFDGGSGPDDMLAAVFSNGQVFLYQGDDPASANSWEQVTRWVIPQPKGYRPWVNIGATTVIGTVSGPVDLQRSLSTGPSDYSNTFSQKISGVVTVDPNVTTITKIEYLQAQNDRLLIQTKWEGTTLREMLVMDTDSRAWTLFGNLAEQMGAFTVIDGRLIGSDGSSTAVSEYAWATPVTDYYDNTTNSITYDYTPAYWDFEAPGVRKQVVGVSVRSSGSFSASGAVATVTIARDLEVTGFGGGGTPSTGVVVSTAVLSAANSGEAVYACTGNGYEFAIGMSFGSQGSNENFKLYGFDVLVQTGGPL